MSSAPSFRVVFAHKVPIAIGSILLFNFFFPPAEKDLLFVSRYRSIFLEGKSHFLEGDGEFFGCPTWETGQKRLKREILAFGIKQTEWVLWLL